MSNFSDIVAGLKTVLETNISGLKAFDYPTDSVNSFPCAVILPTNVIDYEVVIGANTFESELRVVLLVASGDDADGFRKLWDFIDPTDATNSVRRAVRVDRTLNGKADDADVSRAENIGRRELWGGFYFGADFIVPFIKSVA